MSIDPVRRGAGPRWVLPALALLFIGPLVAAVFFYYFGGSWRPASSVNHGRLLDPPITLAEIALPTVGGSATAPDFLKGRWSLIYLGEGPCEAACLEALDRVRRVRLALREKAVRVHQVLLVEESPRAEVLSAIDEAGMLAVLVSGSEGAAFVKPLADAGDVAALGSWAVYVVDPLGNAMMMYGPDFEMKGMLDDLKRLLKLSRIG